MELCGKAQCRYALSTFRGEAPRPPNGTVPATASPRAHPTQGARTTHRDDHATNRYAPPRGSELDVKVWLRLRLPGGRGLRSRSASAGVESTRKRGHATFSVAKIGMGAFQMERVAGWV